MNCERKDDVICPVCWLRVNQPARKPGQRCGAFSTGCVGRVMLVKLADKAQWKPRDSDLLKAAKEVMGLLEKHGPSIVPHLMDTDENAGQRLRDAIAKAEGK